MRNVLLYSALAVAAVSASAQEIRIENAVEKKISPVRVINREAKSSINAEKSKKLFKGKRQFLFKGVGNTKIDLAPRASRKVIMKGGELPTGYALYENFEGKAYADGEEWLPDGWTVESKGSEELKPNHKWHVESYDNAGLNSSDGDYAMYIETAYDPQDEWLILPKVTVEKNMTLNFDGFINPFYIFSTDNIDWDTSEYIGGKVIAATLKVMARVDGGEWTEVWDASTKYLDNSMQELMKLTPQSMQPYTINLDAFVDKQVEFAFQYVGCDGGEMLIDKVAISLPTIESFYIRPLESLFWGFDDLGQWSTAVKEVSIVPVYSPVTWLNDNAIDGANYEWKWYNPLKDQWVVDNNPDELTISFEPNYSTEITTINNFSYPPVLSASMPGTTPSEFMDAYVYLQAGGEPRMKVQSSGYFTPGLVPFGPESEGITYLTVDADPGELETPITGYDKNVDEYWRNYTFGKAFEDGNIPENYVSYVDGIMNVILPASSPLVVDGATLIARGKVADDASLTLKIFALGEDGFLDLESTPIVSAICQGDDIVKFNFRDYLDYLTLNFKFDEPVVLSNENAGYIVLISGYHNDKFEYFAPMQSAKPNPNMMNYGYLLKYTDYPEQNELRASYMHLANLEGEYGECYNAFAINLHGRYGWLKSDVTEVSLPWDGTPVEVAFDSFYDGADFQFSELEGVKATASGRYGDVKVSISKDTVADAPIDGSITVSVPGFKHEIKVTQETNSVSDIDASSSAEVVSVYSLDGAALANKSDLAPGVYVVRYSDGSVRKLHIK